MRVLFLTNFYPPVSRGGYEQWCQEVAEGLLARGHEITVLTSGNGRPPVTAADPAWVRRELHLEMAFASLRNSVDFFISRKNREKENLQILTQTLAVFAPDAVLIWGMWNLPRSLPAKVEACMPDQVVYYMGDYWPALPSQWQNYWHAPPRNFFTSLPKRLLKPAASYQLTREKRPLLRLDRVIFPTNFLKEAFARKGIIPQAAAVIYGAVDTRLYSSEVKPAADGSANLLYMGRLAEEKGVHTAIEALGILVHQPQFSRLRLTIVGSGEPEYEAYLRDLARQKQVDAHVDFLGVQPKEALPGFYHAADILLFTSIWPEPFGRVPVEAMASKTAVVGTAVGGAAEILQDNANALLFAPGDPTALAGQIAKLIKSPALREKLVEAGYKTAVEKFDIRRMTSDIEQYLAQVVTMNSVSNRHYFGGAQYKSERSEEST